MKFLILPKHQIGDELPLLKDNAVPSGEASAYPSHPKPQNINAFCQLDWSSSGKMMGVGH